jgi:hypothetical protein
MSTLPLVQSSTIAVNVVPALLLEGVKRAAHHWRSPAFVARFCSPMTVLCRGHCGVQQLSSFKAGSLGQPKSLTSNCVAPTGSSRLSAKWINGSDFGLSSQLPQRTFPLLPKPERPDSLLYRLFHTRTVALHSRTPFISNPSCGHPTSNRTILPETTRNRRQHSLSPQARPGSASRQVSQSTAQVSSEEKKNPMVISDTDVDSAGGSAQAAVMKALEQKLGSPIDHGPQVPPPKPLVIIISGPSGVGKDAVIKVSLVPPEKVRFIQVFWRGDCEQ